MRQVQKVLVKDQARPREDPRIKRTRELLTQAFGQLLGEKSFQSITVSEITERARVNRVTFYAHFHDKFDLLEYATQEMIRARIYDQLGQDASYSRKNLKQVITLIALFLGEMDKHCPPPHGQLEPLMEKQITNELYELLLQWLEKSKVPDKGPSAAQAAIVASWSIYGAAHQWARESNGLKIDEFVNQVLPLIEGNLKAFVVQDFGKQKQAAGGSASGFSLNNMRLALSGL